MLLINFCLFSFYWSCIIFLLEIYTQDFCFSLIASSTLKASNSRLILFSNLFVHVFPFELCVSSFFFVFGSLLDEFTWARSLYRKSALGLTVRPSILADSKQVAPFLIELLLSLFLRDFKSDFFYSFF